MPQIVQPEKTRTPQWIALGVALLLVLGVTAGVVVLKIQNDQKQAFETAKSRAVDQDKHSDTEGAAKTLKEYLDTKPPKKYADQIYVPLATYYLNVKNYDKSIEFYKKADQVDPKNHGKAVNGLALAYEGKGDKAKALEYYKQLLDITKKANTPDMKFEIKTIEAEMANLQEQKQ